MNKGIKETLCLTMAFALIAGIFAGCKDKIAPDITSGSEEVGETTTTITVPVVSDTDPVAGADNGTNGGAVPSTGSFPGLDYTILATDPFGIRERHKGYHIRKVSDPDIHYYIIICSGEKNTGGYGINVTRIEMEDDDTLIIEVAETSPAEGDIVTQAFTYPQCIIELSRMPGNLTIVNDHGYKFEMLSDDDPDHRPETNDVVIPIFGNEEDVIEDGYIAVLSDGGGEIVYKTYVYKDGDGYRYVNATSQTVSWGAAKWEVRVDDRGNAATKEEVVKASEIHGSCGCMNLPGDYSRIYTIDEFLNMDL